MEGNDFPISLRSGANRDELKENVDFRVDEAAVEYLAANGKSFTFLSFVSLSFICFTCGEKLSLGFESAYCREYDSLLPPFGCVRWRSFGGGN
jgi:hypothetical protein